MVRIGATEHEGKWVETFGDVGDGELAVHVDSAGLMALAVRGGRADEELNAVGGIGSDLFPARELSRDEHDAVIQVAGLMKRYGQTIALDGLDLEVDRGEVHGFLGPNGAGKTTTIRILLGLIRADGGTARLFGGDPWSDATELHRRLAYVPGDVTLWPNLTGGEVIDLLGRLRGGLDLAKKEQLLAALRPRSHQEGPNLFKRESPKGGAGGGSRRRRRTLDSR